MAEYTLLEVGDPAPWFRQRSTTNQQYVFDTAAGRYLVLCFFLSAGDEGGRAMLQILDEERRLFDDAKMAFFGVTVDPADLERTAVTEKLPGIRFFLDFDRSVSRLYGSAARDPQDTKAPLRRFWMILDPMLGIRAIFPATPEDGGRAAVAAYLRALPPPEFHAGPPVPAPVLAISNVIEPALCQKLVDLYDADGGTESGFMRDIGGKTAPVTDFNHKRRSDYTIEDEALMRTLQNRVRRRVVPIIQKIHQFDATRMERYIVGCYDSATSGHFRPHRDNTTKGTAHRRFAMSVFLNDDYEGGELMFPEYGSRRYKGTRGSAIVFSCSMLHMVTPMTKGKRYVFLPFLYDEAAATLREQNNAYLGEGIAPYRK